MSGKFVRASKYRHVFGQAAKKELQFENVKVTNNAWDSNIIKTNGKFISVNWKASGGGAFAVIPINEVGKLPDQVPLFRGHTAQVLDTDFDPFNERRIASSAEDSKIAIWEIPEDYSFRDYMDENGEVKNVAPIKFLTGHKRKVGHVLYHPVAQNILASSSLDYTVRIWNIETGENVFTLTHPDMVTSMSFSYDGSHIVTVARDKKLRVWNIVKGEIVSEGLAHQGAKNQRVVWLGNSNRLATTGFSRLSDRQIGIWDAFNLEGGDLGGFYTVDQSSGILMPFYDDSNKILYLAGKGDGNIRYYEFQNDELFELSEFQSTEPQRGFAVAPKRLVNIKENEVLKCFKTVVDQRIEPLSFYVPRRSEEFQDDIYPDAPSSAPALTAEEWIDGKTVDGPLLVDMRTIFEGIEPEIRESKKMESAATTPIKTNSKPKTKAEPVKQVETPEPASTATIKETTPTGPLSDVLAKDSSVDKLLTKSTQLDFANDAEDPSQESSNWDENDDKPVVVDIVKPKETVKTAVKIEKKEVKPEPTSIATDRIKKEQPAKEEGIKKEIPAFTSTSTSTPNAAVAGTKSMGLKQSVEKLSSLVVHLEKVVTKLTEANLDKDVRLVQLENKIEQLLSKQ